MRRTWRRFATITVAVLLTAVFLGAGALGTEVLERGPWAGLTRETVVISFQTSQKLNGRIEYGPAGTGFVTGIPLTDLKPGLHHIPLKGLKPGERYAYRILFDSGDVLAEGKFATPPHEFQPFTFLVYGDTRTFYDRHRLVALRMAKEDAAFVVHVGDLVESPAQTEWDSFFTSGRELLRSKLFLSVIGNHERNSITYYQLFTLPGAGGKEGEQWWWFRWGDVLLVGLDSNTAYLGFTGLRRETEWLKEILSQEARFKFVFFHHPLFSSDPYYGGNNGLAKLWHPIFVEKGVDAVFCGHVHAYEHIVRDGVHYFTTGGGGAPAYPLGEPVEGSVFRADMVLHYLRVTVEEGEATVEMVPVAQVPPGEEEGAVVPLEGKPMERTSILEKAPAF